MMYNVLLLTSSKVIITSEVLTVDDSSCLTTTAILLQEAQALQTLSRNSIGSPTAKVTWMTGNLRLLMSALLHASYTINAPTYFSLGCMLDLPRRYPPRSQPLGKRAL